LEVAEAFHQLAFGREKLYDPVNGRYRFAIRVPSSWTVGDIFCALQHSGEVRSIETILVELYGIAIVTFFKAQTQAQIAAVRADLGVEPVPLSSEDCACVHSLSSCVVLGPHDQWNFHRALPVWGMPRRHAAPGAHRHRL